MGEFPHGFHQGDRLPDTMLVSLMVNDVPRGRVNRVQALAEANATEMSSEQFNALVDQFREAISAGLPATISEDDLRIRQRHGHK